MNQPLKLSLFIKKKKTIQWSPALKARFFLNSLLTKSVFKVLNAVRSPALKLMGILSELSPVLKKNNYIEKRWSPALK